MIFFTIQNIKIYPYNYLWLNNFAPTKAEILELDYWGISSQNISKFFNRNSYEGCIISNRNKDLKRLKIKVVVLLALEICIKRMFLRCFNGE